MAVEYKFYTSQYGGTAIPDADWKRIAHRAEARLQFFTFGRLKEKWPENAQYALCEMAECIYLDEKQSGKTSESTDGYSVSYDTSNRGGTSLYEIASSYLLHSGLMDLGVD